MTATLPQGRVEYVRALSCDQQTMLGRDSRRALVAAWPHRHDSFRAPMVVRANVAMLRLLAAVRDC